MAFRKRVFAGRNGSRPFKRSRFTNRFRFRNARFKGRRNGTMMSGQMGNVSRSGFRKRMIPKRVYRSLLMKDTMFKPHFRSVFTNAFTLTTPLGLGQASFFDSVALSAVTPFWTVAGGAQPIDLGVPVAIFDPSSIVLRGGLSRITFTNNSTADSVRIQLYVMWAQDSADASTIPPNGTLVPTSWEPTVAPDLTNNFKMMYRREFILLPGSRPMCISHRYKPQKIDSHEFLNASSKLHFMYTLEQTSNVNLGAESVTVVLDYNLSFVGDVLA